MNTKLISKTISTSAEQTARIGEQLSRSLEHGAVVELISDVGGGKTCLAKGLAKGFDSRDVVSSPSFTIAKEYYGRGQIFHFDFYRLTDPGMVSEMLVEAIQSPGSLTIIEWSNSVEHILPLPRFRIKIDKISEFERNIEVSLLS
jgi:tRNA threonylcarbamoyladenosine biosynthesis protein TsaE